MLRKHPVTLDTLLSRTWVLVGKRTPARTRDQSRDLLFYLLCRLYEQGPGNLGRAQLVLPQGTLARASDPPDFSEPHPGRMRRRVSSQCGIHSLPSKLHRN
jgi:hypothetical protein